MKVHLAIGPDVKGAGSWSPIAACTVFPRFRRTLRITRDPAQVTCEKCLASGTLELKRNAVATAAADG